MLKIRRSHDRLIFNMGIPIPGKAVFILRRGPGIYGLYDYEPPTQLWYVITNPYPI